MSAEDSVTISYYFITTIIVVGGGTAGVAIWINRQINGLKEVLEKKIDNKDQG